MTGDAGGLTHGADEHERQRAPGVGPRGCEVAQGPVVGRKNHYGSRSLRGTQVAALFYTLCETAKLVGVDPNAYLLRALHAAITHPGVITFPDDLLSSPLPG